MKLLRIGFVVLLAVASVGCKRYKVIPDDKLKEIFKEIYLVNAYVSNNDIGMDSVEIYEPIFRKYKYDVKDFKYTIDNFSRRKSSHLSHIIDGTIAELENEYRYYEWRVSVLDGIQEVADEHSKEVVYTDSLIHVTRISDTARLRIKIPVRDGIYRVEQTCFVDSADKNTSLRNTYTLVDTAGKTKIAATQWLRTRENKKLDASFEVKYPQTELVILLGNYRANMKRPDIRIDSLIVTHFLPKKEALDLFTRSLLDYRLTIDGKEYMYATQDSLSLGINPPWLPEKRDSIP